MLEASCGDKVKVTLEKLAETLKDGPIQIELESGEAPFGVMGQGVARRSVIELPGLEPFSPAGWLGGEPFFIGCSEGPIPEPLPPRGPAHKAYGTRRYGDRWALRHDGDAVIVQPNASQLIIRVIGDEGAASLKRFCDDTKFDAGPRKVPRTFAETESCCYLIKPPGVKIVKTLAAYPGLEFLSEGDEVAGAGSPDIVWDDVPELDRLKARVTYALLNRIAADPDTEEDDAEDDGMSEPRKKILPSPYVWVQPEAIAPREFIYGDFHCRKLLGLTVAAGGTGKSSLLLVEQLAMASGKPLLGVQPMPDLTCWYWNGEDPKEELDRRVAAAMKFHGLKESDISGRFFIDSGRDLPIKIAVDGRDGTKIVEPVVKELIEAMRDLRIDSLVIDPYVSTHSIPENDNGAMDRAAKKWSDIGDKTNGAVHISHHVKKLGGREATIEDSRGAIALRDAARIRRALNVMTVAEAEDTAIPAEERGRYVSAVDAGSSLKVSSFAKQWTRLASVDLGNARGPYRADNVGVVTAWEYKRAEPVLADGTATDVLAALKGKGPWRESSQAKDWIGAAVAKAAGLDLTPENKKHVAGQIAAWLKEGKLVKFEGPDANRITRPMIGWPDAAPAPTVPDGEFPDE